MIAVDRHLLTNVLVLSKTSFGRPILRTFSDTIFLGILTFNSTGVTTWLRGKEFTGLWISLGTSASTTEVGGESSPDLEDIRCSRKKKKKSLDEINERQAGLEETHELRHVVLPNLLFYFCLSSLLHCVFT